jgi:hypothetical protein
MFSYFTIQSNVLVLGTSAVLAVRPGVAGPAWRAFRLAALAGITVTGLVYAVAIAPYIELTGRALVYDYVFHYVVPAASVIGFLLVGPRLPFRGRDMVFTAWPVAWLVYTLIRGAVFEVEFVGLGQAPSHYPYRFLDFDRVPAWEVALSIALITALIVGVGLLYIWTEGKLSARTARRNGR